MSQPLTVDFSQPIALFPLPGCTLLPHATVPLHIFEPRYRRMTADALAGSGLLAMALFAGDGWKDDYLGTPALRPAACLGHIARHEKLPDGRYHLLLQGVCRCRIIQEMPHKPYRMAMLEPIEPDELMEIDLADQRRDLEAMLADPLLRELASVSAIHQWLSGEVPTPALADLTTLAVCDDVEDRYAMLAEPDIERRLRWLATYMQGLRRTVELAGRVGESKTEDGMSLN